MARKGRVVHIPKPPKSAFDKNRPAGALLRAQAVHLRHALARHVQKVARHLNKVGELLATDLDAIKTEGHVSDYAKRVTAVLHPRGGKHAHK
jgi:hypothetical protein